MDWHQRFTIQAGWTRPLRDYLLTKIGIENFHRVLEVGCGTGVILNELEKRFKGEIHGIDIDMERLGKGKAYTNHAWLSCGDAVRLPFSRHTFDLVLCHFLLLWLKDPFVGLEEMARVTKPGGFVIAFAEPDYSARIDFPKELKKIGAWQEESLRFLGANPAIGRRLADIFSQTGLQQIQVGVLGAEWTAKEMGLAWQSEWEVFMYDIQFLPEPPSIRQVKALQELDIASRRSGNRVLYVPTFFAWGKKP